MDEKVGQLELLSRPPRCPHKPRAAARAVEESRLGVPLIFGADVWHGMWTVFLAPLAEAASWDPDLAYQTARASAVETTASGLMWTFSPMVDTA